MNNCQLHNKRLLYKTIERRRNYVDPMYLLKKGTNNSLQIFMKWKNFFQRYIHTCHPYEESSKHEISEKDYYQYVKIVHLVGLFHRKAPYWFRNQAIHFLSLLHEKWQSLADKLDQDYFLGVWIFERDFLSSQVVFGLNGRMNRYANMFDSSSINRPIPFLSKDMQNKISLFNITYQKVIEGFSREDLDEMPSKILIERCKEQISRDSLVSIDINRPVSENMGYFLENELIKEVKHDDEEPYYIAHVDNVWVLQRKG